MSIERIVVTGDVFRTVCDPGQPPEPNQLANVVWLCDELRGVLHTLTGLSPEIGYRSNASDGGQAVVTRWYGLMGHIPSLDAWAATFHAAAPPALVDALAPDYERALVVGFELSPLLRSALDAMGVPWIDVEMSPIRFLDDLALTIRCSSAMEGAIEGLIHPGLVGRPQVAAAVARERVRHRNDPAATACSGACIFLAQTRHDRTLIKDGRIFPDSEAVERVAEALDDRRLILKPHPLFPANPLLAALQERYAAPITDANIYALLAAARDVRFVTISSSAAVEARHFGHGAHMLHPAAHAGPAPCTSLNAHRSAAFWRPVLAPVLPVTAHAEHEEPMVPDRLRDKINVRWGFLRQPARPKAEVPAEAEHAAAARVCA